MKSLVIEIFYPDSITLPEIKDYAQDALEHWGGQFNPEDHLFGTVKAPKNHMRAKRPKQIAALSLTGILNRPLTGK